MTKSWIYSKNSIRNNLEELGISYDVEHRRVKYPRLEFKSANKVLVILPLEIKDEFDFIAKKRNWIKNKFNSIKKTIQSVEEFKENIHDEEKLLIFGKYYPLIRQNKKQNISLNDGNIHIIGVKSNSEIENLRDWIKTTLKKKINAILNEYLKEFNIIFNGVNIRVQKTKWGSCSSNGNLNFNLKLLALPDDCLKYVVFHELIHVKNKYHNESFWKIISLKFPDFKEIERLLTGFWFLLNDNNIWNKII